MSNLSKYNNALKEAFSIDENSLNSELKYQSIDQWDSVGHMGLIANLEEAFDISMEMDDVIDFGSYDIGIETLKKYGIEI